MLNSIVARQKLTPHPFDRPRSGLWPHTPLPSFLVSNSIVLTSNRPGLVPNLLAFVFLVFSYNFRA